MTTLAPEAVDTPMFANAANYGGREVRPIPPVLSPDEVAAGIEACAENPKHEVTYGRAGRALEVLYSLAPPLYRRLAHPAFVAGTFGAERREASAGNVLSPAGEHRIEGGWRGRRRGTLRRALVDAALAALRGRAGGDSLGDTESMASPPDRDAERKGEERAEAAAERAENARRRAATAHREAEEARTDEATERHQREAEIHEQAARLQDAAQRLQTEHAEEAREGRETVVRSPWAG